MEQADFSVALEKDCMQWRLCTPEQNWDASTRGRDGGAGQVHTIFSTINKGSSESHIALCFIWIIPSGTKFLKAELFV